MDLPDELPQGYYLDNFNYLVEFVYKNYSHLLNEAEKGYYNNLAACSGDAKKLYVRLSNRKGPFFRTDKLSYEEINSIDSATSELMRRELIGRQRPDIESCIALCSKAELLELDQFDASHRKLKKEDLAGLLVEMGEINPVAQLGIDVIEVLGLDLLLVFRLLFFGNFHQDMTEFVLHELVAPFETYDLSPGASAFQSRALVDEIIELRRLSDYAYDLVAADETGEMIVAFLSALPDRPRDPMAGRRHDRIVNRLARQLERFERAEEALRFYRKSVAPPARERQARLLIQTGFCEDAIRLCEEIAQSPLDEEEKEFAVSFGARMSKRHKIDTCLSAPVRDFVRVNAINIPKVADHVEQCAVEFFRTEGNACFYVENALFNSLFGLCFWDIIFAPVSGAFFNPFQRGPADLYTSDFRVKRKPLIDARLVEIQDRAAMIRIVNTTLDQKYGTANSFVYWAALDPELLHLALNRIPPVHYVSVFNRMLQDLKNNTSGFPDLITFNGEGYELVEIKGPGDKIQKNQERWFRHFHESGIPASLTNVSWSSR